MTIGNVFSICSQANYKCIYSLWIFLNILLRAWTIIAAKQNIIYVFFLLHVGKFQKRWKFQNIVMLTISKFM
jgi:hypothetical protein